MPNQPQIFYEINEFDVFLERCLQKKIVSHTVNPLTKPGDNYGSIMQSISVKIAGEKGCEEVSSFYSSNVIQLFQREVLNIVFFVCL